MTRKTVLKRFLPVLLILVIVVCAVVIFSRCSTNQTVPYGAIDKSGTYYTVDVNGETVTITKQEIYDKLRYQAYDPVVNEIENAIFSDYINQVKTELADKNSDTYKDLIKQIDSDCFNTSDKQTINKMEEDDVKRLLRQFYDNLQGNGYNVSTLNGSYDYDIDNLYTDKIFESYYLSLAKQAFAREKLLIDIKDEDSDYYIDFDDEYESQYDNSYENQGDVKALIIKFDSKTDTDRALMELNIKFNRGLMYYVPRPDGYTDTQYETYYNSVTTQNMVEIEGNDILLQYVRIYNTTYPFRTPITLSGNTIVNKDTTIEEISSIASRYTTTQELIDDILLNDQAYELNEDGSIATDSDGEKIQNDLITKNAFSFTHDELTAIDSSICSYIYNTLAAETYATAADSISSDFYDGKYQSTPKEQSASSGYFLAFKFLDAIPFSYDELSRLAEIEGENGGTWTDELSDAKDKVYDDIIDSALTTTYINEKVNELYTEIYENDNLLIFDPLIQTFYKFNNSDYSKTSKKSNDLVLSLDYSYTTTNEEGTETTHTIDFDLSADALYERLNRLYGSTVAYDIASGYILESLYSSEITETIESELSDELETLLASFSQGGMESSGYPASIGKQTFLEVYLNVSSSREALSNVYRRARLEEFFYDDLETQAKLFSYSGYDEASQNLFGALVSKDNEDQLNNLYKAFAQLAKTYYDEYTSLKYTNILIYTDFDEDGNHDDPQDYYEDPTDPNAKLTYSYTDTNGMVYTDLTLYEYVRYMSAELFNLIITETNNATSISQGLTEVTNDYSAASKYSTDPDDEASVKYAKFKKAGLQLTVETETTSTNNSSLVEPFLDNISNFYNNVIGDDKTDRTGWNNEIYASAIEFTSYMDATSSIQNQATSDSLLETEYGYHALYVTGYSDPTSTKWNFKTDNVTLQGTPVYDEIYDNPTNDYATIAQIKTFVEDYEDGYEDLPSQVQTGLQACFSDKYTKFTGTNFQAYMTHLLLNSNNGTFANQTDSDNMSMLMQTIRNTIDSYEINDANTLWWSLFEN